MEHRDKFVFVLECLDKLNYPQLITSDTDSLREIFKKENRSYFVSWYLKKLDNGYEAILETATTKKLGDILESLGFCSKNNKDLFLKGETDGVSDICIVYNMFKLLDELASYESDSNVVESNIFTIPLLSFGDINLFPQFGAKPILSREDKQKKILEYQREVEKLKQANSDLKNTPRNVDTFNLEASLQKEINVFEQKHPLFVQNVNNVLLQEHLQSLQVSINFRPTFSEVVRECQNESRSVFQFLDNLKNIEGFIDSAQLSIEEIDEMLRKEKKHISLIRQISDMTNETTAEIE